MTDTLPDRLAATPGSPYYNEELLARGVGIRFNGVEKTNVEEYCVSEGWVRLAAGPADAADIPLHPALAKKAESEEDD